MDIHIMEVIKNGKTLFLKEDISVMNLTDILTSDIFQAKRFDPTDKVQITSCLANFYLAEEKIRRPSAILVDNRPRLITIRITTDIVNITPL